ncbi:MAG: hypothetical protein ABIG11_04375, partial [bacterium]
DPQEQQVLNSLANLQNQNSSSKPAAVPPADDASADQKPAEVTMSASTGNSGDAPINSGDATAEKTNPKKFVDGIKEAWSGLWGMGGDVNKKALEVGDTVNTKAQEVGNTINTKAQEVGDTINKNVSNAAETVGKAVEVEVELGKQRVGKIIETEKAERERVSRELDERKNPPVTGDLIPDPGAI